jgi:nucleotide-binding universal stress UspA family protein
MTHNVLIAVDESAASRKAVEYAAELFGRSGGDVRVTLFHAAEALAAGQLPKVSDPNLGAVLKRAIGEWSAHAPERAEALLHGYRDVLVAAGLAADAVHVKYMLLEALPEARRTVAALAIIDEARAGNYTTVVVGRRGTSNLPEAFLGGVAEKVSRHLAGMTVWIVD